jgi:hypothetical protein
MRFGNQLFLYASICGLLSRPATCAQEAPAHGLWVWKSPSILEQRRGAETLRDFCRSADISEVYISVPAHADHLFESQLVDVINLLHRSKIQVEALLSSNDADETGAPRDKLIGEVRHIVDFNARHRATRFDGIHLDIEPQQRPENKGPGNLKFLPGLIQAYQAVWTEVETLGMPVNADIQTKLLKANLDERRTLLSSLPRFTLMLYEVNKPDDGETKDQMLAKLRPTSQKFLDAAYSGLGDSNLARMTIALRTPDYGELLPTMLHMLDEANRDNLHYRGWARHSYNDSSDGLQGTHHR